MSAPLQLWEIFGRYKKPFIEDPDRPDMINVFHIAAIVGFHRNGMTLQEISRETELDEETIELIIKNYLLERGESFIKP